MIKPVGQIRRSGPQKCFTLSHPAMRTPKCNNEQYKAGRNLCYDLYFLSDNVGSELLQMLHACDTATSLFQRHSLSINNRLFRQNSLLIGFKCKESGKASEIWDPFRTSHFLKQSSMTGPKAFKTEDTKQPIPSNASHFAKTTSNTVAELMVI